MSDQSIEQPPKRRRLAVDLPLCRKLFCLALMIGIGLLSPIAHSQETRATHQDPSPLLVRARKGDTPASLALRYLNDPTKGWMIAEYNGLVSFSDGQAVIIPTAPFRLGGLNPSGYQTVPVLVYTSIGDSSGPGEGVCRIDFEEQMSWIKNGGFISITPAQLVDFMECKGQLPRRAILVTADTESATFFDHAAPVLSAFGLTATLCVATDHVGKPGNMTWDQLRQLKAAGFAIGCRGGAGRSLIRRRRGQSLESHFNAIEADLKQAKKIIEHEVGETCVVLAYPHGRSNDLVAAIAAKLGFCAAFVRSAGENPFFGSRFGIHRLVIDRRLGPGEFTQMLITLVAADFD